MSRNIDHEDKGTRQVSMNLTDGRAMTRRIDPEDQWYTEVSTVHLADSNQRGNPNKTVINESLKLAEARGLYTAIFAKALGYREAEKMTRNLDAEDVGPHSVRMNLSG